MRASARVCVARDDSAATGAAATRISDLRSSPPLVLRPTDPVRPEPMAGWLDGSGAARVSLVAGAAGPVGGDELHLDVTVRPGAALILREVTATLLLPGPHGRASTSEVTVHVAAGGTLVWLPRPIIAARDCRHHGRTRIRLDPGARLLAREELVLGRHGEQPGSVRQRLRVTLGGRPVHDQELHLGPGAPGWDGPAVTDGRRAVGSLLLVDPAADRPGAAPRDGRGEAADEDAAGAADTALLPLAGAATLVTALAPDALTLRRRLDTALRELERTSPSTTARVASPVPE